MAKRTIRVGHSQKQKGATDCGVFAIAFATAIAFGINPSKLKLKQEAMRAHLVYCFSAKKDVSVSFLLTLQYKGYVIIMIIVY